MAMIVFFIFTANAGGQWQPGFRYKYAKGKNVVFVENSCKTAWPWLSNALPCYALKCIID